MELIPEKQSICAPYQQPSSWEMHQRSEPPKCVALNNLNEPPKCVVLLPEEPWGQKCGKFVPKGLTHRATYPGTQCESNSWKGA